MFITTNELAFATQFMSPMSTGLDKFCKCKSQIDNSSLNLTTIQVHDSCWNSTVHFLQGTVRKLSIWGCLSRGGVLPSKMLLGMCRWMGSHFHNWTDYNGVTFLVELLEWGRKFSGFLG